MNTFLRSLVLLSASLATFFASTYAVAQAPGDPPPVPDEDMAVQPRGPVHEAFVPPPNAAPRPGPLVTQKPPDGIREVPPDQRPEGDNVQWIPGYWGWDAEAQKYLWISGVWRIPPTGRKWMPGVWNAVEGGFQWSPGFWALADQDDFPLLQQQPPNSLDNGPSSPAPDDDSFYVPGNWAYQGSQYAWQPGYWQAYRPGMMWTPSYYNWSPGGYQYVAGFWDWPLANRGLLFAPMMFNRPLWNTPGWFYRPSYVVPVSSLLSSLFMGPAGYGYYFGNYYGPSYSRLGYRPWFAGGYGNPLFGWYRWNNRGNPGWWNGLYSAYRGRYYGSLPRPPLTFNQQNVLVNKTINVQNNTFNTLRMVQPLHQYTGTRLNRLSAAQVAEHGNQARNLQRISAQRLTHSVGRTPGAITPVAHHVPSLPAAHPIPAAHVNPPSGFRPHPLPAVHPVTPAPVMHHAPAPVHHAPAPVHHAPVPVHHKPAPVHHAPAPVHHAAPSHGGGGHGGGHHR